MEPLEFEFVRDHRLGFLDLQLPAHPRRLRPLSRIQMLKREVRRLDPVSLAVFSSWIYWYDSTAWERRIRRKERASLRNQAENVDDALC
jgi:hypothetical protein